MEKIILLLDDSPETNSSEYLSKLISMGIYNFTKNAEGVQYLYNNPNSYRDVAHIHQIETQETPTSEIKKEENVVHNTNCKILGVKGVTKEIGRAHV